MSDLKLYNGINNIDDDLIEEADCKKKPVIHHCYGIAASAAAIFIAVGALGVFRSVSPVSKTDLTENNIITVESTAANTTEIQTTSPAITEETVKTASTAASPVTSQYTAVSTQPVVSYSKTNEVQTKSLQNTTAVSAAAAQTEAIIKVTTTIAVNQDGSDIQDYDYEYEGSIIMRKYAAALAALLIASNPTTAANAQTYEPTCSYSTDEEELIKIKNLVDEYDLDMDINCDGNIDIFDAYAFYRAQKSDNPLWEMKNIPDYIQKKYKAIRETEMPYEKESYDPQTNEQTTYTFYYSIMWYDYLQYLFANYPVKPEYYDPNYFIENCPDDYNDPIPLEIQKQDIDLWDIVTFKRNKFFVKNDDGSFRHICADDYRLKPDASEPDDFVPTPAIWRYQYVEKEEKTDDDSNFDIYEYNSSEVYTSPIYDFIDDMRYWAHGTARDYKMLKDIIDSGYLDVDINSDGVFDFDDVVKIIYASDIIWKIEDFHSLFVSESEYPFNYFTFENYDNITEEEYYKVLDICKVAAHYFINYNFYYIGQYFTEYYLTYNEIDEKYFDPVYYEDLGYYTPNPRSYSNVVFANLSYYEQFSIKYGPNSAQNSPEIYESPARYNFTSSEIDAAFPKYYKNVKTGKLPKPDIDLDGKITAADYNILFNLDLEKFTPYDNSYSGTMIKRHPELNVVIGVPQEVRDNFDTNFDFNNNGISADELEVQCMMMYILHDLETQYGNVDDMNKALDLFYTEHPELQYYEIFNENLEDFNSSHGRGYSGYVSEDEKVLNIYSSVDTLKYYSSYDKISLYDIKGNGDANNDGSVDLSDAVLIMQSLANPSKYGIDGSDDHHITEEGYLLADVDGDGVTNNDALTIQRSLLGLEVIA